MTNQLKSIADRIGRLMDERDGIGADIRDIYTEAKSNGYVPKVLRKAIARKRMDTAKRDEEDGLQAVYEAALGMAVELVRGGLSLREAERQTGISKSVIHRAISVPAVSRAKGILLAPEAWAFVSGIREAWEAEKIARRTAERERRRAQQAAFDAKNAEIDADPLTFPPHLDRRARATP